MERKIETQVKGFHAIDGGGVHLVRVLGNTTVKAFNPFLMLDSFDSTNPEDYVAGFPMHPHRGIETITFVAHGNMRHKDSMGFEDIVQDGEVQYCPLDRASFTKKPSPRHRGCAAFSFG